jgi:hypothetical protein
MDIDAHPSLLDLPYKVILVVVIMFPFERPENIELTDVGHNDMDVGYVLPPTWINGKMRIGSSSVAGFITNSRLLNNKT